MRGREQCGDKETQGLTVRSRYQCEPRIRAIAIVRRSRRDNSRTFTDYNMDICLY